MSQKKKKKKKGVVVPSSNTYVKKFDSRNFCMSVLYSI